MRKQKKFMDRLLSMVLALLLAFNILPATAYASNTTEPSTNPEQTNYTITVKEPADATGTQPAVEGATVKYTIKAGDTTKNEKIVTTDSNGVVTISDMADTDVKEALTSRKKILLTYEVSKDGYNSASASDIEIADVTGNTDVELSRKEQKTISAAVTGSGLNETATVKANINGTDTNIDLTNGNGSIAVDNDSKVTISVVPKNVDGKNNVYIKSLSIAGNDRIIDDNNKFGYSEEINVSKDITIRVTLGTQYTVTVNGLDSTKGEVTLDGTEVKEDSNTKIVEAGTKMNLAVTPNKAGNYQIKSVKINNEDKEITSRENYKLDDTVVNEDTTIDVDFEKLYIIEAIVNGNGTFTPENACVAGGMKISEDNEGLTITATPNKGYRVASVEKNNVKETYATNDKFYKETISKVEKDYKYVIKFEINQYDIKAESDDNGTVKVTEGNSKVNYNAEANIEIKPNCGYKIKSVKYSLGGGSWQKINITDMNVDEKSLFEYTEENDVSYLKIKNVKYNYEFKVSFEKAGTDNNVSIDNVLSKNNLVTSYKKQDELIYIYQATQTELTIDSDLYDQISLPGDNYQWKDKVVTINDDCTIDHLYVRKKGTNNPVDILNGKKIKTIVQMADDTKPEISIEMPDKGDFSQYNKSIKPVVKVTKTGKTGICDLSYKIIKDENDTDSNSVNLANCSSGEGYLAGFNKSATVDADTYNYDNLQIVATATDWLGYTVTATQTFSINKDTPKVEIKYEDNSNDGAETGYYTSRTATITVIDRKSSFNKDNIDKNILSGITATDAEKNKIEGQHFEVIKDWTYSDGKFTKKIKFTASANYKWSIKYTNNANSSVEKGMEIFTVDKTNPKGSVNIESNKFEELLEKLTFGGFKSSKINVSADSSDDISPTHIYYYKNNEDKMLSSDDLDKLKLDEDFKKVSDMSNVVSINPNEQAVIYLKIIDLAGNYVYVSSKGYVADSQKSSITIDPQDYYKKIGDGDNATYIYNKNNQNNDGKYILKVEVKEPEAEKDSSFAGIKAVSYRILVDDKETEPAILYNFDNTNPSKEDLKDEWSGTISVDASENNSSNVVVEVTATDNAGNTTIKKLKLDIDITNPDISVSYNNNKDNNGNKYFNANREATVSIKERTNHFDEKAATEGIKITAVDAKGKKVLSEKQIKAMISNWTTIDGTKPDEAIHSATISYTADANYTFKVGYTDEVGNTNNEVTIGDSVAPYEFTVDKNKPTGTITINKNTWSKLLNTITFGLWGKTKFDVSATKDDVTSPTELFYYKSNEDKVLSSTELDRIFADNTQYKKNASDVVIDENEQATIYTKVIDSAGNYTYISSDGHIVDNKACEITLTPDSPNKNGFYNKDVNVAIGVTDDSVYSGIQSITYRVKADGNVTQSGTLYSFEYSRDNVTDNNGGTLIIMDKSAKEEIVTKEGITPTKEELRNEWSGNIVVDAGANNSSNVVVEVTTTDNAGNTNIKELPLDIDVTNPDISVSYDNNTDNGGNTYFNANREATVSIKERTNHFDEKAATEGIKITAMDAKGKKVLSEEQVKAMISRWTTTEGTKPDEAVHTATISYTADANYTFDIAYTDMADNANNAVVTGDSVAPYNFTVDKNAPTGTVTAKTAEGRTDKWDSLIGKLTFGIWSGKQIDVSAETDDITSPVASVQYYKTAETTAKTVAELDNVTEWEAFNSLEAKSDEQFTVYLKIVDMAGNITYISTNGLIVDSTDPRVDGIAPEVTISPEQPINGIYNRDVNVAINVQDVMAGSTYSGLKTVSYRVLNMGTETQSGVLYSFDTASPTQSELKKNWAGNIIVDSSKNNSNDVVIEVYAEDNAKNSTSNTETIKIDVTKPQINISYDNNNPDSQKYYKESRTATVVVTERNFDPNDIKVNITNTDGKIPQIGNWSTLGGDGNLDNTTHTATITYEADGDYTFDIDYTDEADNHCDGKTFAAGTANETEFTIDKTIPTIAVSYNNNASANGKYFNSARVATVTINEHNFDASRVQFTQTATLNGSPISAPAPSWSNNGDVHTATFSYDTDGDYTFDVTMTDMAGNQNNGVSYSSETDKNFTVDTKIDKPVISGVENGKAYKGDVVPTIDFSDINYSDYSVSLVRTRKDEKDVDVTADFIKDMNISAQGGSGTNNTFDSIQDNDGIYTLTVKVTDLAGNEAEDSVTFTLNRFGSVYTYNDYLSSLIQDGGAYVKSIDKDIEITEYNADRLVNGSLRIEITKDGKPIENAKYTVSPEINDQVAVGDSGWFQYGYNIAASNFKEDGVYKMTVSSEDATGNTPENTNYADKAILFRVDSTAPEISSISGLENNVINATKVNVKYTVYDTIGLASVKVYVNGKQKKEITDFESDDNNYSGTFNIGEKSAAQAVRLVVEDKAGNITDTDSDSFKSAYTFNRLVTISTNLFVRWFANKTLFYGTLGGVAIVAIGAAGGIVFGKRKKTKASANAE